MTIKLHDLRPAPGSKTKRTRVGRGEGSKGKTAGWLVREDWEELIKLLSDYGGMEKAKPAPDYYTNEFFDCN